MAEAAVSAMPWPRFPSASFCDTSPSIEALARWNRAPQAAKTSRGRDPSRTPQAEGRAPRAASPPGSRPRATSWSIAPAGTAAAAATLAAAVKPMDQNRTGLPRRGAASRIARLIEPSPRWNSASLRPARRAKRAGPTTPSEIAARVGPIVTPASAPTSPAAATVQNRGASGMTRQVAVTTTTAPAIRARLARTASTSAPMGACDASPVRAPIESAAPMLAGSQPCSASR